MTARPRKKTSGTRKQPRRTAPRQHRPATLDSSQTGRQTSRRPAAVAARNSNAPGPAPGMQRLNTYLAVANIPATMEFLERAFGFTRGVILPGDGGPRYAEMRHGTSAIMLVPRDAAATPSGGAGIYAYVDDVDRALRRARDAGAAVAEAEDRPWGDRTVAVTDPDGYRWVLATFKKLAPFQGAGERRSGVDRRKAGEPR